LKISDGPQQTQFSVAIDSPRDITNWNQPFLFFQMYPTNTIVWARKRFIGSVVPCGVDFEPNLGCKSVMDPSSHSTSSVATDSPRDTTNWNQLLSFFQMDPTNTIVWARKSFIGSVHYSFRCAVL
jgi:hypothetical protein